MTEPTPRPWTCRGGIIRDAEDDPVVSTDVSHRSFDEDEAIERLIVRAVNAHDEMVAALKRLIDLDAGTASDDHQDWDAAIAAARAALAKAGAT